MSKIPTLLVTRRLPPPVEAHLAGSFDATFNETDVPLDRQALVDAMTRFDALCPTITDRIDAGLIATPGRTVRIIANFGAGLDHIDLEAARSAGVVVTHSPDALTDAAADLAILLMLMAARRAGEGERELRAGRWTGWRPTHLLGQGLAGKTLGLVGYGRIARATAARAATFGLMPIFYSRHPVDLAGVRFAPTLESLAEQADILSLHVPGGAATHHMIDAALLARMKPTAIVVNTARGSVIDEAALAAALLDRRIAAAGLDVFEREPSIHPGLLGCENAVLLPHLGSATLETRTAMGLQVASNLESFFAGREPANRAA